jgi:hypothetical protein
MVIQAEPSDLGANGFFRPSRHFAGSGNLSCQNQAYLAFDAATGKLRSRRCQHGRKQVETLLWSRIRQGQQDEIVGAESELRPQLCSGLATRSRALARLEFNTVPHGTHRHGDLILP